MSDNKATFLERAIGTSKSHKKIYFALLLAVGALAGGYARFARMRDSDSHTLLVSILLLAVGGLTIFLHAEIVRRNEYKTKLNFQKTLFENIFEQAPIGIILRESKSIDPSIKHLSLNPMAEHILGRSGMELHDVNWTELTHKDDLRKEMPMFEKFQNNQVSSYTIEKRLLRPDGSTVWVRLFATTLSGSPPYDSAYMCLIEDISAQKTQELALSEQARSTSVLLSHIQGMAYRCKADTEWTMEFVSEGCSELTGYEAESIVQNKDISYMRIIAPEYRQRVWDEWERVIRQHKHYSGEYEIITKNGEKKWVLEQGQAIYDADGRVEALEGIIFDFTEQKSKDQRIAYLQERDFLTGLYNRDYMEKELRRLDKPAYYPLSVAICDIDGLRMINSAFGHEEGDRLITVAAKLIQSCLKQDCTFARMGGGEFMILLPAMTSDATHRLKIDIKHTIESFNLANQDSLYTVNLSIGHSTKENADQRMEDVLNTAGAYLQRRKLLNQNSTHSAIVSSVMATLYAKSQETETHGIRLGRLCQLIGEDLRLDPKALDDLQLLSKLHDIGKIGTDDRILNKPARLTPDEWEEMKQHPRIGYDIAMTIPHLEHIAEYILHHHERWDGQGYPVGLHREDIPLLSRVLAVADAYDAMTERRIYRDAIPKHLAIEEIRRCSGTQFDPDVVDAFLRIAEIWDEGDDPENEPGRFNF